MQDVLNELNQFKGSTISSALGDELEEELVAAILSSLLVAVKNMIVSK